MPECWSHILTAAAGSSVLTALATAYAMRRAKNAAHQAAIKARDAALAEAHQAHQATKAALDHEAKMVRTISAEIKRSREECDYWKSRNHQAEAHGALKQGYHRIINALPSILPDDPEVPNANG